MKKRLMMVLAMGALMLAMVPTATVTANGDNNGQAIGQDDLRLLLTQCSDAGRGNGDEVEAIAARIRGVLVPRVGPIVTGASFRVLESDCFDKHTRRWSRNFPYSDDEVQSILKQSAGNCEVEILRVRVDRQRFVVVLAVGCEIDPGNSGPHNNGGG